VELLLELHFRITFRLALTFFSHKPPIRTNNLRELTFHSVVKGLTLDNWKQETGSWKNVPAKYLKTNPQECRSHYTHKKKEVKCGI